MRGILFFFILFTGLPFLTSGQPGGNTTCQTSDPFCGSNAYTYPAGTCGISGGCNAQPGPCYSCLSTTPNPAWFYLEISTSGNLIINITENPYRDVDFCCWGPFTSPTGDCQSGLTCAKVVSCSYSPSGNETCTINGAQAGEFYILLITNYSNQPTDITFTQSNYGLPGAGSTNCNIVVYCSLSSLSANPTACNAATNTFDINGSMDFSNAPPTGTLTITDQTAIPPVSQTFFPPFVSPQVYSLTGITCDGQPHNLLAAFSDSATCLKTHTCLAPPSTCPVATISGGGTVCNNGTNTGTVNINITNGAPPYSFTYAINSVPQIPIANYSGPFPYVITAFGSGTYTMISVSDAACSGTVSGTAIVLFVPLPTVTLTPLNPVCITALPFPLSGGAPAGGTYSGTGVTAGIFDPSAAGVGPHTITYTYTDNNNCTNSAQSILTVDPIPIVTVNIAASQICSGTQTNVSFQSTVPGSTYTWTATSTSVYLTGFSNGSGAVINQTLVNSGNTTDSVTYTVTPHANGCNGNPVIFSIKVFPVPDAISNPASQTICSNTSATINLTSGFTTTTFTWTATGSSPQVSGYSNGSGNVINQTLINSGPSNETVTYKIVPVGNGCLGDTVISTVIVRPYPDLSNNPLNKSICNNTSTSVTLSSSFAGTLFTWTTTPSSVNVSGYSDNSAPTILLNQTLLNSGFTTGNVIYHITPHNNGCNGLVTDYTVNVFPVPDVLPVPSSQSVCSGQQTSISLNSDVTGTTFTWTATGSSPNVTGFSAGSGSTIAQTLSNSGFTVTTVTYHITPSASGCTGTSSDVVVTVFPLPGLSNNPAAKQQCNNLPTNINLTSNVAGTMFTWTCTPSSGNVGGWSNNPLPTILLNQTLTNSGFSIETVTYHITANANGCTGNTTDYVVTVYPAPNLSNSPLNETICKGGNTNLNLTSGVAGTLFTWTCTPSSGFVVGYSDNAVPTTLLNQTLDNLTNIDETVTYHLTPHANGCDGPPTDYVVTVKPRPILTVTPMFKTICSGDPVALTLTASCAGTTFSWIPQLVTGNVTGFASGSGTVINDILTDNITTAGIVTYTVSLQAGGCIGNDTVFTIHVNPTPHLTTNPLASVMCSASTTNISLTSDVAGATFVYTATGSSPNVTGFSGGINPVISQTLTNTGFNIETVTYHITPSAGGCNGPLANYTVTVYPVPDLSNIPPAEQICNNQSTNLVLTSHVAGTLFTWTCTPSSGNVVGWSNNNIPTTFLNQPLVNTGFAIETVTYHITPHANGCNGPVTDFVVTLVSKPDLTNSPPAKQICNNTPTNVTLTSNVNGTLFTWIASGSSGNISGYSNNAVPTILLNQTLSNSGFNIETVTYRIVPHANGCAGDTTNYIMTVYPTPDMTNNPLAKWQCNNTQTNIGLTSNVTGTLFTWTCTPSSGNVTGWSNNAIPTVLLNQTLANSGFAIETVTYHITPHANNCNGLVYNYIVTVYPTADVYFNPVSQSVCSGQSTNVQNLSHVPGTTFVWTASGSSGNVSGYSAGSGTSIQQTLINSSYNIETVTYAVSPTASGCPGTSSNLVVTVNPLPAVTLTSCWDSVTTTDAQPFKLNGGIPAGGTYSGPGISASSFFPGIAGPGAHAITYNFSNSYGCSGTSMKNIIVIGPPPFVCGNTVTDIRDNKSYPTLVLGTQCWMAANLNYGQVIASSQMQRDNCVTEKYCYSDNPANCSAFGGLYQWDEVMRYDNTAAVQGLCPPAWHIPTETEWTTLFNFYTSNGFAGSPLKITGYSGFNAAMYGMRFDNDVWKYTGFATLIWSSTEHGTKKAWAHGMNTYNPSVSYYPSFRSNAFSVRCIKD
jgi:uncharacterized protein (TIGR02145 family)